MGRRQRSSPAASSPPSGDGPQRGCQESVPSEPSGTTEEYNHSAPTPEGTGREQAGSPPAGWWRPSAKVVLRRPEQATVAVLLVAGVFASAGVWWSRGGANQQTFAARSGERFAYRIDINHCHWTELAQVTGIGETLARRIVELREQRGGFRRHDELLEVKGIGPKKFAAIQPYLLPLDEVAHRPAQLVGP